MVEEREDQEYKEYNIRNGITERAESREERGEREILI
jgi:hypothetical protein